MEGMILEMLENRMVVDAEWRPVGISGEEQEETSNPGYTDFLTGTFVSEEAAFDYALEKCLRGTEDDRREFREMLVEWFYSNWKKEE